MVYLTSDWDAFEGYARNCRVGTYQIRDHVDGKELRVKAGRLGYIDVFELTDEVEHKAYDQILEFCRIQGFIQVFGSIDDEVFHA